MSSIKLSDAQLKELGITRKRLEAFQAEMEKSALFPGAGVEFVKGRKHHVISAPRSYPATIIIIEERTENPLKEAKSKEAWGAFLNCGSAVAAGIATAASAGGTIISFGSMTPLLALSVSATAASSFQCGASITRLLNVHNDNVVFNPEHNKMLDDNNLWQGFDALLNWIQIADAGAGLLQVYKNMGKFATLRKWAGRAKELGRLPPTQRKEIMLKVAEEMTELTKTKEFKRWIKSQGVSSRFSAEAIMGLQKNVMKKHVMDLLGLASDAGAVKAEGDRIRRFIINVTQRGDEKTP